MRRRRMKWLVHFVGAIAIVLFVRGSAAGQSTAAKEPGKKASLTAAEAQKFIEDAEQRLFDLGVKASRAGWVQENFITDDTEQIAAEAGEAANTAATKYAKEAHRFDGLQLSPEPARKRLLLELAAGFPAPDDPKAQKELAQILADRKTDPRGMVKYGENFFTSLGFAPLPKTFWERSLFTKPADRDVVCHASAWDVDSKDDLRVKMCMQIREEDFRVIHHELGHNFYQRAYKTQPPLFQSSANDGFHEAVGDTIALSVTPEYLKQIGLIDVVPPASGDTDYLLQQALEKVAFLPFGLLVDKWRWEVFGGQVKPADYNKAWWELRKKYQGIVPPVERTESDFDPGAKYHVPGNVPYARYFLARILQFQFQRALCREAGFKGPLHRCSIYGNKAAGEKLNKMLAIGQSKPWPEALETLTGEKQMDASALADYFAPLQAWLDEQNKANGYPVGW